jgi:dephospho-CoA kinase
MQQTILAIAGKPGLFKLISRGKSNLIVEALDATHRRQPAFGTDRITSLADIAMYTETDDGPLMDVLESLKTLEDGKKASIDIKKAGNDELRDYFAKVLPAFDRERVHNSDIKKLLQWYNILIENGITDFKEEEAAEPAETAEQAPAEEAAAKEATAEEAPAKKAPAKKVAAKKKAE